MQLANNEKWIPGYEGKYFATFQGEIFRKLKNGKNKQLKGYKKTNTYCVKLCGKEFLFNRVIWETFKGPIPDGYLVVRRTPILEKNDLHNLRLRTKEQHGVKTGPTSRSQAVVLLDDQNEVIDSWSSARKAAKDLFVSYQTVMDICNKKIKREPVVNVRWEK